MAVSKCMSDVSLKYRWASWLRGGSLPRGAELCHCLGLEDGGKVEVVACIDQRKRFEELKCLH